MRPEQFQLRVLALAQRPRSLCTLGIMLSLELNKAAPGQAPGTNSASERSWEGLRTGQTKLGPGPRGSVHEKGGTTHQANLLQDSTANRSSLAELYTSQKFCWPTCQPAFCLFVANFNQAAESWLASAPGPYTPHNPKRAPQKPQHGAAVVVQLQGSPWLTVAYQKA